MDTTFLKVTPQSGPEFGQILGDLFTSINLVPRLRETRAMCGFDRVQSRDQVAQIDRKRMLWIADPDQWLPGYVVIGEGIFLNLNPIAVSSWKAQNVRSLTPRINLLQVNQQRAKLAGRKPNLIVGPEFLLIHTLAHLLINRLVYECGYQAASLRERLYCAPDGGRLGILIYTASGDSDGTMGGLVRMGEPDRMVATIRRALEGARWCSADPVCGDIGGTAGQGPDSVNLAACHVCALVPETSCETGNRFLDRAVLVGTLADPSIGFFPESL